MRIPMDKINIRRLLTGLGLVVILLLAVAFVLGLLSLQRTREIVSEDFQQQQLILAKTTARQIEDGLEFLRRELKIQLFTGHPISGGGGLVQPHASQFR
jgi:hypothetical protein